MKVKAYEVTIRPNTMSYVVNATNEDEAIDIAKAQALGELTSELHYAMTEVDLLEQSR